MQKYLCNVNILRKLWRPNLWMEYYCGKKNQKFGDRLSSHYSILKHFRQKHLYHVNILFLICIYAYIYKYKRVFFSLHTLGFLSILTKRYWSLIRSHDIAWFSTNHGKLRLCILVRRQTSLDSLIIREQTHCYLLPLKYWHRSDSKCLTVGSCVFTCQIATSIKYNTFVSRRKCVNAYCLFW